MPLSDLGVYEPVRTIPVDHPALLELVGLAENVVTHHPLCGTFTRPRLSCNCFVGRLHAAAADLRDALRKET